MASVWLYDYENEISLSGEEAHFVSVYVCVWKLFHRIKTSAHNFFLALKAFYLFIGAASEKHAAIDCSLVISKQDELLLMSKAWCIKSHSIRRAVMSRHFRSRFSLSLSPATFYLYIFVYRLFMRERGHWHTREANENENVLSISNES